MKQKLFLTLLVLAISATFMPGILRAASVPPTILSYQGRLADNGGSLLGGAGTTYYFKFSLWDASATTTGTRLWPASSPTAYAQTVRQGVFSVNIGDTTNGYPDALTYDFARNPNVYLQVEVSSDNVTYETLSPRQQVTSVPYALEAGAVVGTTTQSLFGTTTAAANSFVTAQATTSTISALTLIGAASQSASIFQIQNNSLLNVFSVSAAGALTLGTALTVPNGGTGQTTFSAGQLVYGAGSGALLSVATSSASCTNGISCAAFAVVGSVAPTITGVGYPFTGNATSTSIAFNNGLSIPNTAKLQVLGTDSSGNIISTSTPTANSFFATSTTAASVFPYASTTALTATSAFATNLTISSLASFTARTAGNAAYFGSSGTLLDVATGTVSGTNGVTATAGRSVFGGALTIDCTVASKAAAGCLAAADYNAFTANRLSTSTALTQGQVLYAGAGGNTVASAATGTVSGSNGISATAGQSIIGSGLTITGVNAVSDGATKGVASFTANDFNDSSGNISIDYTNGQAASGTTKGFLAAADWLNFNNKIGTSSALTNGQLLVAGPNGNSAYSIATTTASCAGTASCTSFTIIGSSPVTISSSGGGGFAYPFQGAGNSTSTLVSFTGGLTASNATTTTNYSNFFTGDTAVFGAIASSTFTSTGALGIGTTSPMANLSIWANSANLLATTKVFNISSSTAAFATTTLLSVDNAGNMQILGGLGIGIANTTAGSLVTSNSLTVNSTATIVGTVTSAALSIGSINAMANGGLIQSTSGGNNGASFTGKMINLTTSRVPTGTVTDTGNYLYMARNLTTSAGAGTVSGDLAVLSSNCAQGGFTCSDTSSVLSLFQFATSSGSGAVLKVLTGGTNGQLASFDATSTSANGVSIDVQSSSANQYGLLVTGNNGATTGLRVGGDGFVGIGTSTPGTALGVNGDAVLAGIVTGRYFLATSTLSASVFNYASTTMLTASGSASTTALVISGLNAASCDVKASANGVLSCGVDATGGGSFAYPFQGAGNSTSTLVAFTGGLTTNNATSSTNFYGDRLTAQTFAAGGTATTTIDSSGNLVLPTTAKLTAPYASTTAISVTGTSYLSNLVFTAAATTTLANTTDNAFSFATSTANTPLLTLSTRASSVGLVGIGTTSPWGEFSVEMNSKTNPVFTVANQGSSTPSLIVTGILQNGAVGVASSTPSGNFVFSASGSTYLGSGIGSTITLHAGTINYPTIATSTIQNSPAAWTLATSTAAGNTNAVISVSGNSATSTIGFFVSTSTALSAGVGVALPASTSQNLIIIGNGKTGASLSVVKGGVCIDDDGWCTASTSGRLSAKTTSVKPSDLAEMYTSKDNLLRGQIVAAAGGTGVRIAGPTDAPAVLGVVSTDPGVILGEELSDGSARTYPIALSGRVPILVNLDGGPIAVGDRLTLSTKPGTAMRGQPGDAVFAIALESYDKTSTTTSILAFVTLNGGNEATSSQALADGALKGSSSSLLQALTSAVRGVVHILSDAVYAATGIFKKIFAQEVHTDTLCVGDTCVTQDQFLQMVQASAAQAAPPPPQSPPDTPSADTPPSTPPTDAPPGDPPADSPPADSPPADTPPAP